MLPCAMPLAVIFGVGAIALLLFVNGRWPARKSRSRMAIVLVARVVVHA